MMKKIHKKRTENQEPEGKVKQNLKEKSLSYTLSGLLNGKLILFGSHSSRTDSSFFLGKTRTDSSMTSKETPIVTIKQLKL